MAIVINGLNKGYDIHMFHMSFLQIKAKTKIINNSLVNEINGRFPTRGKQIEVGMIIFNTMNRIVAFSIFLKLINRNSIVVIRSRYFILENDAFYSSES